MGDFPGGPSTLPPWCIYVGYQCTDNHFTNIQASNASVAEFYDDGGSSIWLACHGWGWPNSPQDFYTPYIFYIDAPDTKINGCYADSFTIGGIYIGNSKVSVIGTEFLEGGTDTLAPPIIAADNLNNIVILGNIITGFTGRHVINVTTIGYGWQFFGNVPQINGDANLFNGAVRFNATFGNPLILNGQRVYYNYGSILNISGLVVAGSIVYNSTPTAGDYIGWVCTKTGVEYNPSSVWQPSQNYTVEGSYTIVFPTAGDNGYYYTCTTSGVSNITEPVWPTVIGNTVTDGSVVWTCSGTSDYTFKTFGLISN